MLRQVLHSCFFVFTLLLSMSSCNKQAILIVPQDGYDWPSNHRSSWPTEGWETATLEAHQMNPVLMEKAHDFAGKDPLARALLVVKDGYLVFEEYYGEGGMDQSTNLWSVTKSFSSALVGLIYDQNLVSSTDQYMAELMPDYPTFNEIKLQHVLTHTTGLSWDEEGPRWVAWIMSDDWVASALARGQRQDPGKDFFYSSGNTHFLNALVYHKTGVFPGTLAKEKLFDPMGIPFDTMPRSYLHSSWGDYMRPARQTWRRDPMGIECASFGLYLTARDMAKFGFLYLNQGKWEDQQILSEEWVKMSTKDHETNIYGRYSYGYQWYLTKVGGEPAFLASGFGGQIIGVVPSMDLVVVLKYEAEEPVHPVSGTSHDDMYLFELVVDAVIKN